ncbi:MFS transporter [Legionella micdadei]|uniref:Multidrug transporter n=1 Tax=Legionella micdadei TaxID=451 RepID=A0A098GES7_LEGMI|nr:MFS transporter [Legionella micdadei]ARG98336.1 MFS transporter [Legionella micdadei]ARH01088.1 MFS transporter [Legionella micdadei]KTD27267.1 transporter of the major facilitator superfamily (MFS) [Legionella micdadei]NSL18653.1 MFS transporter [Legionella micdadei]CEG59991.1 Multidrug transporter [Legionella micdadei]
MQEATNKPEGNRSKIAVLSLFLTIFVDAAGLALIFPILTPLFINNSTDLFNAATPIEVRYYVYGLVLAMYPLMMFLGSPFLGALSDKYGRKPTLLVCLLGNLFGLIITGAGVSLNSISIILLGRIICGITAASLPIAQAAIIDMSTEQTKSRNISIITAANAVGFSIGPVIGGVFSTDILLSHVFSYATPFYITAVLPLLTFLLIVFSFKETYPGNRSIKLNLFSAMVNIYYAFKIHQTRLPIFILGIFLIGYYMFFNYLSAYSLQVFQFDSLMESVLLTYFSVFFAISLLLIIPAVTKRVSLRKSLLLGIIPQPILIAMIICFENIWVFWSCVALMAIVVPSVYVVILSILSNETEREFQGRIMGVSSSINSLAWGIAPLMSAFLQPILTVLPFMVAVVILTTGSLLSIKYSNGVGLREQEDNELCSVAE